jgi:two-component system KDP operon response regulator KdpE
MGDRRRILIVDDEAQIIRVLRHILAANGYAVRAAEDGEAALETFREWQPDMILTDLQMPNVGGLELCRQVRMVSDVPIIVLSVRNEEKAIVAALDAGADDYITKPFRANELLARLRSAFRRVPEKLAERFSSGDFIVDTVAHQAEVRGRTLKLTPKEFDLLAFLVRNPDRVLTHSQILKNVWGNYYIEQADALRVLVGSLRKKIEFDPANPVHLVTEPWIGYRFSGDG